MLDFADIVIDAIKTKAVCPHKSIKELTNDPKLKPMYDQLKMTVDDILQNDLATCTVIEDIDQKVR